MMMTWLKTNSCRSSKGSIPSSSAASLRVPILPHTSPEATPPEGLTLPLYPHQLRALHRCLVIEDQIKTTSAEDAKDYGNTFSLANDFGVKHHYKARGGVLADEVGTGKTATAIALVLSDSMMKGGGEEVGDTLVVAPKHLIPQWKDEVLKFVSSEHLQVVVGKDEYERTYGKHNNKPTIVLVDVDTVLQEQKLWYDWRQVYASPEGPRLTKKVGPQKMKLYKEAALFSVKSAKGPCSYEGWVYTGSLHLPQRPWRRVIYDEIQDLVRDGKESQKNLLQLTRTAQNVWLLSATPFPHGNASVYANHELLGFCRLRMDVESEQELPSNHPFEQIKQKLYIRSPRHVADAAKIVTVVRHTEYVAPLKLEQRFYQLEMKQQKELLAANYGNLFSPCMDTVRQMTVHPEASAELRIVLTTTSRKKKNSSCRPVSASVQAAAQRSIQDARLRLIELNETQDSAESRKQLQGIHRSIVLVEKVHTFRETTPLRVSVFQASSSTGTTTDASLLQARQEKERQCIHDAYCTCTSTSPGVSETCFASKHICFRKIVGVNNNRGHHSFQEEFICGPKAFDELVEYFQRELAHDNQVPHAGGVVPAISNYLTVTRRVLEQRKAASASAEEERRRLKLRIDTLSEASNNNKATTAQGRTKGPLTSQELLAQRHGSKPAALVHFLKSLTGKEEQVVVFSYWHDTLKLVQRTLQQCGLQCVFLEGRNPQALVQFTSGQVPILLLSAKAQASGANLQCATQVVLIDPAGKSGEHGCTLEEQAVGRAARMASEGQTKPVTVTRFCVMGTLEEDLFGAIDQAAKSKAKKANDVSYVITKSTLAAPALTKLKVSKKSDDTEVQVTAAISQAERLERSFQQAKQAGGIIELLDDEAEDNLKKGGTQTPKHPFNAPAMPVRVKTEGLLAAERKEANDHPNKNELDPDKEKERKPPIQEMNRAEAIATQTTAANKRIWGAPSNNDAIEGSEESGSCKRARTSDVFSGPRQE